MPQSRLLDFCIKSPLSPSCASFLPLQPSTSTFTALRRIKPFFVPMFLDKLFILLLLAAYVVLAVRSSPVTLSLLLRFRCRPPVADSLPCFLLLVVPFNSRRQRLPSLSATDFRPARTENLQNALRTHIAPLGTALRVPPMPGPSFAFLAGTASTTTSLKTTSSKANMNASLSKRGTCLQIRIGKLNYHHQTSLGSSQGWNKTIDSRRTTLYLSCAEPGTIVSSSKGGTHSRQTTITPATIWHGGTIPKNAVTTRKSRFWAALVEAATPRGPV